MPPQFFIYTQGDGKCSVKQEGYRTAYEFSDILDAISYIRRLAYGEEVNITCYGPTGQVTFTNLLPAIAG